MATALAIGGWFAQAFIQTTMDKFSSSAIQQYNYPALTDALVSLNISLSKANAILTMSHKMKEGIDLTVLLKQLKEAAYDASDLLGELEYEELRLKLVEGERRHQLISGLLPDPFKVVSDLINDAPSKVREVQKRLDEITSAIQQVVNVFSVVVGVPKQQADSTERGRYKTSSTLPDAQVYGRAVDLEKLTELLLKQDEGSQSSNKVVVPIVSLVGMGGVGKTTLAKCAFSKLKRHFQEKIWICASDPFDVNRLTKEIVETVDSGNSSLMKLDKLQGIVKKKLGSKRFLLVIDDVWNEDWRKWDIFYAPLRLGAPGSKILITTRSHNVAATVNAKYKMSLEGLKEEIYYLFFNRCAFGCEEYPTKYGNLEAIGRKIAARLEGSPLAAKTLGSLLKLQLNEDYWTTILHSEIWNLKQHDNDIIPVLKLSFDDLSPCLKPCFAFCSLFPKDYVFHKDIMVQMWMAQDFIVPESNLRMEDIGSKYFDDLLSRCLFQDLSDDRYVMHDLIHDLAQSIAMDECVRLEPGRQQADIPSAIRHLSVCVPYPELNINDACKYKKLRTLLFVSNDDMTTFDVGFSVELENLLSDLSCVRILTLRGFLKTLPEGIGKLKQLRYLDISYTKIHQFPESLCLLYNLQRLKVEPYGRKFYPKGMENLVNLRNVPTVKFVDQVADIGRLTSLQELGAFNIKQRKIEELQKLTELGGRLYIEHLEIIDSKEEASKAKLKDKKYLRKLLLKWASHRDTNLRINYVSDAAQVLEGLQPHPNIKELEIESYYGLQYPSWLESQLLSNLTTIRLICCKTMEQLPPLGHLPCLKILILEGLNAVRKVGEEFYGTTLLKGFPSLEELMFRDMPEWEDWSGGYSSKPFRCLREIVINNCPKLKVLPTLSPKLVQLSIMEVGLNAFPPLAHLSCLITLQYGHMTAVNKFEDLFGTGELKGFPSLEELEFEDMPELDNPSRSYGSHLFPCLRILSIQQCPKLRNLPCLPPSLVILKLIEVGLLALPESWDGCQSASLAKLCIHSCPNLGGLEEWLLPNQVPAIEEISIIDCGNLTSLAIERFKDFACLRSLTLRDCPKLTSAMQAEEDSILFPSSLEQLHLGCCGDLDRPLLLYLPSATSLSELSITNCSHITSLSGEFLHHLTTLKTWKLRGLKELKTLETLQCCTSLECLEVRDCPELKAISEDRLPSTVTLLSISRCHSDLKERCLKDTGADWPKIAHISRIRVDGELIAWPGVVN